MAFNAPFRLANGKLLNLSAGSRGLMGMSNSLIGYVGETAATLNMLPWRYWWPSTDFLGNQDGQANYLFSQSSIASVGNTSHFVDTAANAAHYLYSFFFPKVVSVAPLPYRVAVIASAAELSRIVVSCELSGHESTYTASVGFDLSGGNTGYDVSNGSDATVTNTTITSLDNGLKLCRFDVTFSGNAIAVIQPKIYLDNGSGTAARSTTYAGTGSSGVNLLWFSLLPAKAWDLNNVAFFDDFNDLSKIDLGDTRAAGFNWYIGNNAPNSVNQSWWGTSVLNPSIAANFTQPKSSILRIASSDNTQHTWACMMYSAGFPAAGGYVGNSWKAPLVAECSVSFDALLDGGLFKGQLGPAFWGHHREAMSGEMGASGHWTEWDILDGGGGATSVDDNNLVGNGTLVSGVYVNQITCSTSLTTKLGTFTRISGLWIDEATNGGWGCYMSFCDGYFTARSDVAYSASGTQPNIAPAGSIHYGDQYHWVAMFDTAVPGGNNPGGSWPYDIDWFKVKTA